MSIVRLHEIIWLAVSCILACCKAEFYVACSGSEDSGFEKKETWNDNCTQVCQSDCNSPLETLNNCSTSVSAADCGSTSTCTTNQGCVCNSPITFKSTLTETLTRDVLCYNSSVTVRFDRCAMKYYGYGLSDIFFGPPSEMTFSELSALTPNSSCFGTTIYSEGPMYQLSFSFGEKDWCNVTTQQNSTHLIFNVGVHAYAGAISSGVDRTTTLFLEFDCTYPRTYTKSLGKVLPLCNETFVNGSCTGSTYYAGRILITNIVYDRRLSDRASPLYNDTIWKMKSVISQLFLSAKVPVKRVLILGLSSGSLIVDYAVEVTPSLQGADQAQIRITEITQNINNHTFSTNVSGVNVNFLSQYQFGPVIVQTADSTVEEKIQNPCYSGTDTCGQFAICIPMASQSYECQCSVGYIDIEPSRPGRACRSTCSLSVGPYCLNNGICIVNPVTGLPSCLCQIGYEGNHCENTQSTTTDQLMDFLPWAAVGILLLFLIILLVLYTRRRRYIRKSFAAHSFLPDAGPSNSDAVVGLMQHGPGHQSFLD